MCQVFFFFYLFDINLKKYVSLSLVTNLIKALQYMHYIGLLLLSMWLRYTDFSIMTEPQNMLSQFIHYSQWCYSRDYFVPPMVYCLNVDTAL